MKPQQRGNEVCRSPVVHQNTVERVGRAMPPEVDVHQLADFFRIFGDSTRVRILWALVKSEMCVCDLCALLCMQQSAISHQLRVLKQARLVKFRRSGKVVYYSLNDEHIRCILDDGMDHIKE